MFNAFDSQIYRGGLGNPAYPVLTGFGYDPHEYISTAQLAPSPYTTQDLIVAKIGGINRLISAVDDSKPPSNTMAPTIGGNHPNPAYVNLSNLVQIITTEINGYLSSIYPLPLAQTGTVCVLQVTGLSTDGLNSITGLDVVIPGNYLTAPAVNQTPAYMRYVDPLNPCELWENISVAQGLTPYLPQSGSGASLTVTYAQKSFSDESGQVIQVSTVSAVPVIVSGGKNYCLNDLLVLVGGSSIVPAQIRQAVLDLICHTLYQRRLSPDEKNIFDPAAKMWRNLLSEIREGEKQLDGTFKRRYSAVTSWGRESVMNGANSL